MMDLSRCTQQQRVVISTVDKPLLVSAGAGSGKTFTLTQRIVNALCISGDGRPFLDSIDEVCAITFTKKAAAELRSRIKTLLVKEGFQDQANIVDDAWISTIHGMAARILRENALEIGIDPAFEVIGEIEADALMTQATEDIACEVRQEVGTYLGRLLERESMGSAGGYGVGAIDKARMLLARVYAMPDGFSYIREAYPLKNAEELLREMQLLGRGFMEVASEWDDMKEKDREYLDQLEDALLRTEAWLESGAERDLVSENFDMEGFRHALYAYPPTTPKFRIKAADANFFSHYRSEYARIAEEAECSMAFTDTHALVELARRIDARYAELKGPSRFDNNDLLLMCHKALKAYPDIALMYKRKFKMIMIDEFQDTDRLQLAIVKSIARSDMGNICTVGDAQQSIYRFRGADVNVFLDYERELVSSDKNAVSVELPDNFRSHADVLSLVDGIFGQEEMFGDRFLHLEPKGSINGEDDTLFSDKPRVLVDVVHYKNLGKAPKTSSAEALQVTAFHVASHFAELVSQGVKPNDMALLLGNMKSAEVFASALRDHGIESMIIGGSTFSRSREAQIVKSLLMYARDRRDDVVLIEILMSPLFSISDDLLLVLASSLDEGRFVRASISLGFMQPNEVKESCLSENDKTVLRMAREVLGKFVNNARGGDVASALRSLFLDCGILDRLQGLGVQGTAAAGNLEKACRIVSRIQKKAAGIAGISTLYSEHLRLAKEKPGVLSGANANYVSIMTVHASKGLEFPHVAVAELGNGRSRRPSFIAENIGNETFVASLPNVAGEFESSWKALKGFEREDAIKSLGASLSPGETARFLVNHCYDQELSESKRLLYVALTRAVKSVMLCIRTSGDPATSYGKGGIYDAVRQAFDWPIDAVRSSSVLPLQNGSKMRVDFEYLPFSIEEGQMPEITSECAKKEGVSDAPTKTFKVPIREPLSRGFLLPYSGTGEGLFSYTSLSDSNEEAKADEQLLDMTETQYDSLDMQAFSEFEDDGIATNLGTAFHKLAQKMILMANSDAGNGVVPTPSDEEISNQAHRYCLTMRQEARLKECVNRWAKSDLAVRFFSSTNLGAEVPFCERIDTPDSIFYLRGEIDGLADNGDEHALLIDYKTGGSVEETSDQLYAKHLFQSQCYAYALLQAGYRSVEACFIRVEQSDEHDASQPQVVSYHFESTDEEALRKTIEKAHEHLVS